MSAIAAGNLGRAARFYDAPIGKKVVMAVTGDREHPLYSSNSTQAYSIINRFYGIKDTKVGSDASGWTTVTDSTSDTTNTAASGWTDVTPTASNSYSPTPYNPATNNNGFYITLGDTSHCILGRSDPRISDAQLCQGEKGVNAPTTIGGFTYFGTSQPPSPTSSSCNNLGTARGYQVNFLTGAAAGVIFANQGLPPSPVAGLVDVSVDGVDREVPFCLGCGNPEGTGADSTSTIGGIKPPIPVPPVRKRLYWYLNKHDN